MAAPYHPEGYLARAIQWVRIWADEPAYADRKYKDSDITLMIESALDAVITDLYNQASAPPVCRFNVTMVANQEYYVLPANVGEIRRWCHLNTLSGVPDWELIPRGDRNAAGPCVIEDGTSGFRLLPIPIKGGDILTVEYVPNGHMRLHQNATPRGSGSTLYTGANSDEFLMNFTTTPWFLGVFDKRPNAYLGSVVRQLGTVADVKPPVSSGNSIAWWPVQERRMTAFSFYNNGRARVQPAWDSQVTYASIDDPQNFGQPGDPQTYIIYEVLPDVDPAIMWLGAMEAAIQLLTIEKKFDKVKGIRDLYERRKRDAQLRWANAEMRRGAGYQNDTVDGAGIWNPWEM